MGYTVENFMFCGHRTGWKVRKKEKKRERADLWEHSDKQSTTYLYDCDDMIISM